MVLSEKSFLVLTPAFSSVSATLLAYLFCFSEMVMTWVWIGESQVGKFPAQCSVRKAINLSWVDRGARCITKRLLFSPPVSSLCRGGVCIHAMDGECDDGGPSQTIIASILLLINFQFHTLRSTNSNS